MRIKRIINTLGLCFGAGLGLAGCTGDHIAEEQVGCVLEIVYSTIPEYQVGDQVVLAPCPDVEVDADGRRTVVIEGRGGSTIAIAEITGGFGG
ncbi:MAG: hypothetical protein HY791_38105 [Deltaproteobacteria bacterium]|nr:hypothetical protein [Deltaproteobacteria bacterium]